MYRQRKSKKPIIIILCILVAVAIFIWTPAVRIISNGLGFVTVPVQYGMSKTASFFGNSVAYWKRIGTVDKTNNELIKQNKLLKSKIGNYDKIKKENEKLKDLLEIKDRYSDAKTTGAVVISKDAGNWFAVFNINKGTSSSVFEDCPVFDESGLIGKTISAGSNWSKVQSLIDEKHSVSGTITRTGDLVQVDGDLRLMKSGLCKMTIITEGAEVLIGDTVETSGMGGVYPKGIVIGTVQEFRKNEEGTGNYAVIKPAVDFKHIVNVLVITTNEKVTK